MKKQGVCFLCAAVVLNLLSGCGGEYAGLSDRGAASGSAVSGGAVSGQAVENVRKEENSYCFRTDTNLYWDDGDVTTQMRLDGSHRHKLKLRGFEYSYLIYAESDFLYYCAEKSDEDECQGVICRVPVGKDEEGFDLVDTEHVEELVSGVDFAGVDSRYIYYTEKSAGQLVQFDRQNKKKIRVEALGEDYDDNVIYLICDSYVFAQTGGEEFFVKNQNETKWHKICDPDYEPAFITYCMDENAIYYEEDEGVPAGVGIVDITKMKSEPPQSDHSDVCREFIGRKQLKQEAAKAKGLGTEKVKGCGIVNMHCGGDRLYLQVEIGYEMDGWFRSEYLMFSKGREETELCYEKDLTDFMSDNASIRTGALVNWTRDEKGNRKWHVVEDKVKAEQVWCYRIVNGKAFLSFWNQKKGRGRVACYELATGIFRWLEDTDKEFYEPCYDDACDEDTYIDDCYNAEDAFFDEIALYQEGGFHDK